MHAAFHISPKVAFASLGVIDVNELGCALRKMGLRPTHQELMEMIGYVDDSGDQAINFHEFLILMKTKVGNKDSNLRYAFSRFDQNSNGYITRSEMMRVMKEFDRALTEQELEAIFNEADTDRDGRITFTEFRALMVRICGVEVARNACNLWSEPNVNVGFARPAILKTEMSH
jgi:calmodulin